MESPIEVTGSSYTRAAVKFHVLIWKIYPNPKAGWVELLSQLHPLSEVIYLRPFGSREKRTRCVASLVCFEFLKVNPPKQGLFQEKQGSCAFQVYTHTNSVVTLRRLTGFRWTLHFFHHFCEERPRFPRLQRCQCKCVSCKGGMSSGWIWVITWRMGSHLVVKITLIF